LFRWNKASNYGTLKQELANKSLSKKKAWKRVAFTGVQNTFVYRGQANAPDVPPAT